MRACTKCRVVKPVEAFPPVRRGEPKLQTWCRECFAAYGKVYYRANREAQKARLLRNVRTTREDNRLRTVEYLLRHPCVDCGERDIVVLQFDHLRDKRGDIATLVASGRTWKAIAREIEKCEVRCSNCHRRKTAQRRIPDRPKEVDPVRRPPPRFEQLRIDDASSRPCRVCGELKSRALFPFRSRIKRTRQHICLACQREVTHAWYVRNKSSHARRVHDYAAKIRAMLQSRVLEYLDAHPCVDCGMDDSVVLDFDHRGEKTAAVSTLVRQARTWSEVTAEIKKCEVRCANCHARRTAKVIRGYRVRLATMCA